jgi:hypothetical protein
MRHSEITPLQRSAKTAKSFALALLFLLVVSALAQAAEPTAELAAFSIFDNVDLADLAKSDAKTGHGAPMNNPHFLSVQSCYVAAGSPAQQLEALHSWDPTRHRELKVFLHSDIPANPSPAAFASLRKAPDNSAIHALVAATQKGSDLQLSREEAKKFSGDKGGDSTMPDSVASFWSDILSGRARSFSSGGTAAQPPYNANGDAIRPSEELNGLLKEQDKVRKQFSGFLGQTGIGRGGGSLKPDLYWELLDVDDQGVVTLGASYSRAEGGVYQAADVLYYASGGYYVALTLYQMWPVTVGGKASTLVWRGDMISAASLAELHGVERLASESAMMKDISKAIAFFRRDTGR